MASSEINDLVQALRTVGSNQSNDLVTATLSGVKLLAAIQQALVGISATIITSSGTYTPTLTNVTNLTASNAFVCQYMRAGSVVLVSGKVTIDPTGAGLTQLGVSLPIASNLAANQQCAGTAASPGIAGQSAAILGDTANDRAQMEWIAVDITLQTMAFVFSYQVL